MLEKIVTFKRYSNVLVFISFQKSTNLIKINRKCEKFSCKIYTKFRFWFYVMQTFGVFWFYQCYLQFFPNFLTWKIANAFTCALACTIFVGVFFGRFYFNKMFFSMWCVMFLFLVNNVWVCFCAAVVDLIFYLIRAIFISNFYIVCNNIFCSSWWFRLKNVKKCKKKKLVPIIARFGKLRGISLIKPWKTRTKKPNL